MYTINNLKYKDILNIASLTIPDGKVTCIIGESGSGKTTLLRHLNKLISCDMGEIKYNGKILRNIDSVALRREVVMLSQNPGIFKGSIRDNLLIGLKFSEKPLKTDGELYEYLREVKLDKKLSDNADKLSGGEKQRLALARIIALEPEIYLLDEPSSALDDETEELIISKLVNHSTDNNKTLIMVTHSKALAIKYGDNVIELRDGKVIKEGGRLNE